MDFDSKENSEARHDPASLKGTPTDIGTAGASLGNLAPTGFDSLQATQQPAACGQHPTGGTVPNEAPAAAVQPAAGEVQL